MHRTFNAGVAGSSPAGSTVFIVMLAVAYVVKRPPVKRENKVRVLKSTIGL